MAKGQAMIIAVVFMALVIASLITLNTSIKKTNMGTKYRIFKSVDHWAYRALDLCDSNCVALDDLNNRIYKYCELEHISCTYSQTFEEPATLNYSLRFGDWIGEGKVSIDKISANMTYTKDGNCTDGNYYDFTIQTNVQSAYVMLDLNGDQITGFSENGTDYNKRVCKADGTYQYTLIVQKNDYYDYEKSGSVTLG